MILAPFILSMACLAIILSERHKAMQRDEARRAHHRLMRELRRHR